MSTSTDNNASKMFGGVMEGEDMEGDGFFKDLKRGYNQKVKNSMSTATMVVSLPQLSAATGVPLQTSASYWTLLPGS